MRPLSYRLLLLAILLLSGSQLLAQPQIAYMIPDIGAANMNTAVEIIAPIGSTGTFGGDGFYRNNPGDALRVEPLPSHPRAGDIVVGPLVVSWDGRCIQTQVFVKPGVAPGPVLLQITTSAGSSTVDFEIVTPLPALNSPPVGAFGGGGAYGTRSKRGAIIVESLDLTNSGTYGISTNDVDGGTAGNQGYLPLIIIARQVVRLGSVTVSANAPGTNGGPGGGGGGGRVCDASVVGGGGPVGLPGGDGYTGGGGGGRNDAGVFIGPKASQFQTYGTGTGGSGNGLSGAPRAAGSAECTNPEGAGGGTGHPFGRGGDNACIGSNGQYGGGASSTVQNSGGGGAGFAAAGANATATTSTAGQTVGNVQLVPLAGGSGGAAANPQGNGNCAGTGGGGGGAIAIYSMGEFINTAGVVTANGANGGNPDGGQKGGGGGSGGGVIIGAKSDAQSRGGSMQVTPGTGNTGGGNASVGRVRYDGFVANPPTAGPSGVTPYVGPTIDTLTYSDKLTFPVSGTKDQFQSIALYVRKDNGTWNQVTGLTPTGRKWSVNYTSSGPGTYFFAAFQSAPSSTSQYTSVPGQITSQVAANIVKVEAVPRIEPIDYQPVVDIGNIPCLGDSNDAVVFKFVSNGSAPLNVRATLGGTNAGDFSIIGPAGINGPVPGASFNPSPADTILVRVRFRPSSPGQKTATLTLVTNDPRTGFGTIQVTINAFLPKAETFFESDTLDFGEICIQSPAQQLVDSTFIFFEGNRTFQISDITAPAATGPFQKRRPSLPAVFPNAFYSDPQIIRDSIALFYSFRPTRVGTFIDSVTVTDFCGVEHKLYLKGTGVEVKITTTTVPNPATSPVGISTPISIQITNTGDSPASIATMQFVPPTPNFTFRQNYVGQVIPPRSSITIIVDFRPDSTTIYTPTIQWSLTGPCNVVTPINLTGIGVDVNLIANPDSLSIIADSCSSDPDPTYTRTFNLRNAGSLAVRIDGLISKNGKVTSSSTRPLPATLLGSNDNFDINVEWRPVQTGAGMDSIGVIWTDTNRMTSDTLWVPIRLQFDRAIVKLLTVTGEELPTLVDLGGAYQCAPARDTIVLQNAGTIQGVITGGFQSGQFFSANPSPPYSLDTNQSLQIEISFNAPAVGDYSDTLVLRNGVCDQEWRVAVKGSRYELTFAAQSVNFGPTNLNLPRTRTVQLMNTTNAPKSEEVVIDQVYIDPPSATAFTIASSLTLPYRVQADSGTVAVDVDFTPTIEQSYTGQVCFHIVEPCDTVICVDLRGEGIESNIYVPQGDLSFGKVYYCSDDTLNLQIFSVGPEPLSVDSIRIVGPDRAGFAITSIRPSRPNNPALPYAMRPGVPSILDSINVAVRFIPANVPPDGPKTATLEIYSDDPKQGLLEIPLTGERTSPQVVGPALVDFGTVVVNGSATQRVQLTNTSNDTIRIPAPKLTSPFRLLTPAPLVIPPNSSIPVDIEFAPTDSKTYNDTLSGPFIFPCGGEMRVAVTGEGLRGETVIAIDTAISGEPGETILIPIILEEAQAIADVGATTFHAWIRMDRSMLLPVDLQPTSTVAKRTAQQTRIVNQTIDGNDRVVEIEVISNPLPTPPDTLAWLKSVVLLGDDITTPITFDSLRWTDGEVATTTKDGMFTLEGYCDVGGNRLIRVEDVFGIKAVVPNPVTNRTEIEFETIENGRTKLEIFNSRGQLVTTLIDVEDLPVQAHIATWEARGSASGIYYVVLTTPTQRSEARVVVIE